jgi:S-adenosylmethionine:tRNA ribosyltransferase-isomerase
MRHALALSNGGHAAALADTAALAPARFPEQRPADARVLVVRAHGGLEHLARDRWTDMLDAGDLVVANDAATLPASLRVRHLRSGLDMEIRLAAHAERAHDGALRFDAVAFGAGDWRTRTEERGAPPSLAPGDALQCGDARLVIDELLGHARLVRVRFPAGDAVAWALLARAGRPVQYAHLAVALEAWDVATPIAARPFAFEAPSAGFALDWRTLERLRERHMGFATLTHAAGLSSTGDPILDARLPLPERYDIPAATVAAIAQARHAQRRVVAVGTTVARALEHAARRGIRAGPGVADNRIGPTTQLRVVDMLFTGTHEPGTSHYELLRAFATDDLLARAAAALAARGYRTHEYGDSMLVERRHSHGRANSRERTR